MTILPEALQPLTAYAQFILYRLIWDEDKKKYNKIPINPNTVLPYAKGSDWQKDPSAMTTYDNVSKILPQLPEGYGIGFLFTPADPFFFVDIDKCLQPNNTWSPIAMDIMGRLDGAAVEISQSGRGLHIFGKGTPPAHANKNIPLNIELYTEWRFVALTGMNAIGSANTDHTGALSRLVNDYFPQRQSDISEWTIEPVAGYTGPEDDTELIKRASEASSAGSVFGGRATFNDLFTANDDALASAYPDNEGHRAYDGSSADAALAQHLAFWTGKNCERIERIMKMSALVRDKWDREDYLIRTITRAVGMQTAVYSTGGKVDNSIAESLGAVKLRASSDKQREYAESIRAQKLAAVQDNQELAKRLAKIPAARTWIDNESRTPEDIAAMVTPVERPSDPLGEAVIPTIVSGFQYLAAEQQIEHFKGCVYVQDTHKILTPTGVQLKAEQFNATYGGYVFQMDESGDKVTRKAWEAFTESQIIRYPKAESTCFRPDLQSGVIVDVDGHKRVNTYFPVPVPRKKGDITPFIIHLEKVLPEKRDQEILLAYMAACVQHKGVKFQWAPLLQGDEGNGKSLFTRCLREAIGRKYYHSPKASQLGAQFNGWLKDKLIIGVEDIFVAEHKAQVLEDLKPMITGEDLEIESKGVDQGMSDVCANFIFNSNYKDALRNHVGGRRYAIFFTAQQCKEDIKESGMMGDYFPNLYNWLKNGGGYSAVTDFLYTYEIPEELNPAGKCHRAPETSSTREAISASLGGVEQDILEAIEEGRPGFAGGWVSSVALDKLLLHSRTASKISHNKRRDILRQLGYDWHPALIDGRVNNPIAIDDHKKPRLYIRKGTINTNIKNAVDVAKAYVDAQTSAVVSQAKGVFGNGVG